MVVLVGLHHFDPLPIGDQRLLARSLLPLTLANWSRRREYFWSNSKMDSLNFSDIVDHDHSQLTSRREDPPTLGRLSIVSKLL